MSISVAISALYRGLELGAMRIGIGVSQYRAQGAVPVLPIERGRQAKSLTDYSGVCFASEYLWYAVMYLDT